MCHSGLIWLIYNSVIRTSEYNSDIVMSSREKRLLYTVPLYSFCDADFHQDLSENASGISVWIVLKHQEVYLDVCLHQVNFFGYLPSVVSTRGEGILVTRG